MYIKKYICTTYVKYHSTSLSSPPVIPHLMRDLSPPVIPHLMRDPFSLDSRLRGNDTFFVIPHLMRDPFSLDSRLRGNDGKKSGNDTPLCHPQPTAPVSSSTESEALRIGDPEITDWIPAFAGMTEGVRE